MMKLKALRTQTYNPNYFIRICAVLAYPSVKIQRANGYHMDNHGIYHLEHLKLGFRKHP